LKNQLAIGTCGLYMQLKWICSSVNFWHFLHSNCIGWSQPWQYFNMQRSIPHFLQLSILMI